MSLCEFQKLPELPAIEVLDLSENYIHDLDGLHYFRKTPLKSLTLTLNPVTFTLNYRQRSASHYNYYNQILNARRNTLECK